MAAGPRSSRGLIAESGTLILSARHAGARRAAFLAETHFALAAEERLYESLADYLAAIGAAPAADPSAWRARAGHALTLITGPSRTADIEKTLVLGAHGPRRLILGTAPAALLRQRFEAGLLAAEGLR